MYVGSQAKAAALIGTFAPRLTARIMERLMYSSHQSRARRASGSRSLALFEAGYGGVERGTLEPHILRGRSFYVQATKRPILTTAAAAAALLLGSAIRRQTVRQRYDPVVRHNAAESVDRARARSAAPMSC